VLGRGVGVGVGDGVGVGVEVGVGVAVGVDVAVCVGEANGTVPSDMIDTGVSVAVSVPWAATGARAVDVGDDVFSALLAQAAASSMTSAKPPSHILEFRQNLITHLSTARHLGLSS
jgi:2-methylcitrate dehydratase PrpD